MSAITLTGSEKQIVWAEKIRADATYGLGAWVRAARHATDLPGNKDDREALRAAVADRLTTHLGTIADAAWWIDNRQAMGTGKPALMLYPLRIREDDTIGEWAVYLLAGGNPDLITAIQTEITGRVA